MSWQRFFLFVFLIPSLFICSCSSPLSNYEKIADGITKKTAKELKTQKNLCLVGIGGRMMDDIQMMAMSFYYYQEVDLRKARELVLYAINKYLLAINNNRIRPYLHEYPFTAKNVAIRIWVFKPDRLPPTSEKIHYISAIDGNLSYYSDLPEAHSMRLIHEESYEEALREIDSNQTSKF